MTLGDAGTANTDASYAGEDGTSIVSMQYYRDKASQFQAVMSALDQTMQLAQATIDEDIDPQLTTDCQAYVSDIQSHLTTIRVTAEAINAGAAAINGAGGRFPVLSVPNTLGVAPIIVGAGFLAALAVAAGIIVWGNTVIQGYNARIKQQDLLNSVTDPTAKASLAAKIVASDQAVALADNSVSSVSTAVKWVAIAAVAFIGFKVFSDVRGGRMANPIAPILSLMDWSTNPPDDDDFDEGE